ncbi:MAG TPA: nicotinate-nucleotide adenylyltransferase [Burkholderiales bacterium]|nr:nicotinate-nucleotide adenylyltransferase [Burkholderiales bacterium]
MAAAAIGVLGGTFDPVHNAHLAIAQRALEALGLARVIWLPTGTPPYRRAPVASAADRVAMLRRALAGEPRYALDERELAPAASGYSVDTLAAMRRDLGAALPLVLLIGSDQFAKLDTWHRWRELFALCHLAVFARPDWDLGANRAAREALAARRDAAEGRWRERPCGAIVVVEMAPLAVAGTEIRARIARGEDASDLLPHAVLDYIESHRLYRD